MMAPEPGAQVARAVGVADFGNARDRQVLDEYVWRLQDECCWRCQPGTGVDESNGTTVAMAEEDGSMDTEDLEKPRSTSRASRCMKSGDSGGFNGSDLPYPRRLYTSAPQPSRPQRAAGKSRHRLIAPSPSCRNTIVGASLASGPCHWYSNRYPSTVANPGEASTRVRLPLPADREEALRLSGRTSRLPKGPASPSAVRPSNWWRCA